MWRGPVALAVIAAVAVAVMPALAAQGPAITASDTVFTPGEVTVAPGESVALANAGGFHNFQFADGVSLPAGPRSEMDPAWNGLSRTFTEVGDYSFVCGAHPLQMSGVIRVRAPAATPTATPTPTPAPEPAEEPPAVRSVALAAKSFCVRRGPRCPRPGVRVRLDLARPAAVDGTLRRRARAFGRVRFGTVAAGVRTLTFRRNAAGRRLTAGRYSLRLRIAGETQPALRFRVR